MQYQALYRKYRPQQFSEVIGQDHVTETLSREIESGKVAHAYLFAGPRGTGKTTTARILAKALNCTDRQPGGVPCNRCESCLAITEGTSLDVIELDAASHNKVEDIREIRANVGTVASVGGAKRLYILDEAHMLSRAAGNALLKTLEEPPEHVIFVLATTEPFKLLDTIRSRSQRFDFHPVPSETLKGYLADVAGKEGFRVEDGALAAATQYARGSVRDALSLLEQVAALGEGRVTTHGIGRALGLADSEAYARLVEAIAENDAPSALSLVGALAAEGADLRRFVADGLEFFRGIFLAQYTPNLEQVVDESRETVEQWRSHADRLAPGDVLRAIDQLAEALLQLREGREERLVVELAFLKLTRPETAMDAASLAARVDRIEERLREGSGLAALSGAGTTASAGERAEPDGRPTVEDSEPEGETKPVDVPPEGSLGDEGSEGEAGVAVVDEQPLLENLDLDTFESIWPALVAKVREHAGPRRHALFKEAVPRSVDGGVVVLVMPRHLPFHLEQIREDKELLAVVEGSAAELLGGAIRVQYEEGEEQQPDHVARQEPRKVPAAGDLIESDEGEIDPTDLVVDMLGGEVVD